MAKHTILVVPGTYEIPEDAGTTDPIGLLAQFDTQLQCDTFDVRFVNYTAPFGPIPGGDQEGIQLDESYVESRDKGVDEVKRLINDTPGTFGLGGFSQGGAVIDLVTRALVEGDMQHRQDDCIWVHAFASPRCAEGKTFHGDDPSRLSYESIAGDPVENTSGIDYFAYALPDDEFTNCDIDNTYGVEIYNQLTNWEIQQFGDLSSILTSVASIAALFGVSVGSSSSSQIEPIANPDFLTSVNTVAALTAHVTSGAQGLYNDPAVREFNGMTTVEDSLNHLNHWGPRV